MRGLLAALLVPVALAGTCADSATLDYPAGLTGLERGSFAPPSEELDGTAGFSIAMWVVLLLGCDTLSCTTRCNA